MNRLVFIVGALLTAAVQAASLHELPAEWTLIARHSWTGSMDRVLQGPAFAGAYVVELKDERWQRAVQALTNIEPSFKGWHPSVDPCRPRDKVLVYRDLSQNDRNQFCLTASTAWRREAQQWLTRHSMVRFAKIDRSVWSEVFFDAAKMSADAARRWAEDSATSVRAGLTPPGP